MTEAEPGEFAGDCFNLWKAGHAYIPVVADAYAKATEKLDTFDPTVFETNLPGQQSSATQDYHDLRDLVQTVLARTSQNLYDVGAVLEQAAIEFAEQDSSNSNDLGSAKEQLDHEIDGYKDDVKENGGDVDDDDLIAPPEEPTDPKGQEDSYVVDDTLPEEKD